MSHFNPTGSQKIALDTYIKLMRASNVVTNAIHRHLLDDKLTHSQFAVLEALNHLGPLSQGELSNKVLKSNANLTTVVDSLEKKDLVVRQRSAEDRRCVTVDLTATGTQLIQEIFPRHVDVVARRFSILSEKEQNQLAALLKKLGKESS